MEDISEKPDQYVGSTKVNPVQLEDGLIQIELPGFEADKPLKVKATPEQFDSMVSAIPYKDGQTSERKWRPTVAKIITLLMQDNLEMVDKDFVLQQIDEWMLKNYREAAARLWKVESSENVSLKQIDEVLRIS